MRRWMFSALTLASMVLFAWPAGSALAAIDISGGWNLTLLHPDIPGSVACSATVTQTSGSLSVPMTCSAFGSGTLTGTIDVDTGTFNLSGTLGTQPVNFAGTAAMDGNSASGFWVATGIPSNGTFSGIRTADVGGMTELTDASSAPSDAVEPKTGDDTRADFVWLGGAGLAVVALAGLIRSRRRA